MKEYIKPESDVYRISAIHCIYNSGGNLHPSEPDPEEEGQLSKETEFEEW